MPRLTLSPALRPKSTLGRMPAAITTRSASMQLAVGELDTFHVPVAQQSLGARPSSTRMPICSILPLQIHAARQIELHVHQRVDADGRQ